MRERFVCGVDRSILLKLTLAILCLLSAFSVKAQANLVSNPNFTSDASWIVSEPSYTSFGLSLATPSATLSAAGVTTALDGGCVGTACLTYPPVLGTSSSAAQLISTVVGEGHFLIFWTYFSGASTAIDTIQTDAYWGNTRVYSVQPIAEGWQANVLNLGVATTASNTLTFLIRNDPSFSQVTFAQVLPYPRLVVSKSGPSGITVTQAQTYTVVVTNNSPGITATSVILNDALSPGLPQAALGAVTCTASGTAICPASLSFPIGGFNLPPSSALSFGVGASVSANTTGTLVNRATATSSLRSTLTSVLSASVSSAIIAPANLSLSKTNGPGSVVAGGTTQYQIIASNSGPAAANQALIKDSPSPGLLCNNLSCSPSGGASCPSSLSASTLTSTGLTIPVFPPGGSVTLLLTCQVTATGV